MLIHISLCHEKRAVEPLRRERHSVLVNLNCSGDVRVIDTGYSNIKALTRLMCFRLKTHTF